MTQYVNELAPWERRREYYHQIKLGKDVLAQTEHINRQTKAMVASQLASTSAIIASQDRISEGIDSVSYGLDRVEQGIQGLASAFEWGISEVVWQIEQNREVLKSILEVLMAPLNTQAKERRKRAEEAFANGWIDDAEEEFLESERLNKFDFSIHISLGIIYLFHKIDKAKALSYFEKAIKYAKPKSAYYASYALLYKGLMKFDFGEVDSAEKCTEEAICLCPDLIEGLYQNAQYNAQMKSAGKSIKNLERAIKEDKFYCLKAHNNPLFDPIREHVKHLIERLKDEEKQKALKLSVGVSTRQKRLCPIVSKLSSERFVDISALVKEAKEIDEHINDLEKRIKRNSYFDFLDINGYFAPKLQNGQNQLIRNIRKKIEDVVLGCETDIKSAKSTYANEVKHYLGHTGLSVLIGSFAVPAVTSLIVLEGLSKLIFILFCIPILSQLLNVGMVYFLFTNHPNPSPGEPIVAISIIIYLVASICYFFIATVISRLKVSVEVRKQNNILRQALPYVQKIHDLCEN